MTDDDGQGGVDWPGLSRVLAVRLDNLGDVVMVTPALRALRGVLGPAARLDLLASPAGASLAPLLADVDDVHAVSAVWQDADGRLALDPARELALVERLRGYDAVVVFTSFAQSPWPMAYAAYLAGVPVRVGVSKEFGGSVLTHRLVAPPDEQHQTDRALALLESVGIPPLGRSLSLRVPPDARERADEVRRTAGLPDTYAVLAPGASCPSRRWDPARFGATAAALDLPVAVVGTAKESELVRAVTDAAASPHVVGLAGALDVPALAALIEGARVALTNNSGGMHLADAVGTAVVTLFAGTEDESQFAPRSVPARLLRVPTSCAPCRAFACPYSHECLDIAPATVAAAVREPRRVRVLTWHVHGSYLWYLSQVPVTWVLPVRPGGAPGYGGRTASFDWPDNVVELPADEVAEADLDLVVTQSRANWETDRHDLLGGRVAELPRLHIEHDPPQGWPNDALHPVQDEAATLVHVTPFNDLMWDSGRTPTRVVDHGVVVPDLPWTGETAAAVTVVNNLYRRGRRLGPDVFDAVAAQVPVDLAGMNGGAYARWLGDVPLRELHRRLGAYRCFLNPIRYTSMGLAVCEAMALGLPVVGLATTEMATAVQNGVNGYVETDAGRLAAHVRRLLEDHDEAAELSAGARTLARERFGIERFVRDWLAVLTERVPA